MQELKISKANALKAFRSANTKGQKLLTDLFGEEVFVEKITERVKSYGDACDVVGIHPLTISDFRALPESDQEPALAHHQLTVIARALNEGWVPDWTDSNQYKYYPWFNMKPEAAGGPGFSYSDCHCAYSGSDVGSRLVFKSSELAEYAGKHFLSIYKSYFVIK